MKYLKINWEMYHAMADSLYQQIKESGEKFNGICGIPKGGLIPAVQLRHKLDLPLLNSSDENTLIVDDISDTGSILSKYKYKKIAVLYTTDWTAVRPDFFSAVKEKKDQWIIFPWEDEEKEISNLKKKL